jgi:hypothetical protein
VRTSARYGRFRETGVVAVDWFSRSVGAGGLALAVWSMLTAHRAQRRSRPMVICEEVQAPQEVPEGGQLVAQVRLSNPSDTAAYNLRLGLELEGARITWGDEMSNPPRVDKLPAGTDTDPKIVLIPPGWAFEREADPWSKRVYWVDYQDSADWWWTANNPWDGHEDVRVKSIGGRARWWLHRRVQAGRQRRAMRKGQRAAERSLPAARAVEPD